MSDLDLVLRARRAITAAGEVSRCVGVAGGRIVAIEPYESGLSGRGIVELDDDVVLLPGLVDTHVHVNEPAATEWEGFATATRAAAAGGITTIVDMPLNSIPPTVDVAALEVKRRPRAAGRARRRRLLGRGDTRQPGRVAGRCTMPACSASSASCCTPASTSSRTCARRSSAEYLGVLRTFGALTIVHAEDSDAIDRAPAPHGAQLRGLPGLPPARRRERRRSPRSSRPPG